MTIAAHIESSATTRSYLAEYIISIALQQPQYDFVIFSSKQTSHGFMFPANCKLVTIKPIIRNSLLLHYWNNYKLPRLLIKVNAAVFISETNSCSLRSIVPQVMLIKQPPVKAGQSPKKDDYHFYYKRFFFRFADKAKAICVTEQFIATALIKKYPGVAGKVTTILHGLQPVYTHLQVEEKEQVLLKYAGGHEYFLCECSLFTQQNLLAVLKAFSIFKKRLKSGMRLIVLNRVASIPIKDFKNYKYRNEVLFISNFTVEEEQILIGAAYAGIYMPSLTVSENVGLHCMQSAVPLICSSGHGYESMYESAAMFTSNDDQGIAACMMTLYKDELFRSQMVAKGIALSDRYNWHESSAKLWQTITNYIPV